jgi:hypothetical protein
MNSNDDITGGMVTAACVFAAALVFWGCVLAAVLVWGLA